MHRELLVATSTIIYLATQKLYWTTKLETNDELDMVTWEATANATTEAIDEFVYEYEE
jgi:hypothetical protein